MATRGKQGAGRETVRRHLKGKLLLVRHREPGVRKLEAAVFQERG